MIINKITYGYVVQAFDTEKQQFVSQSFYAGDKVFYETRDGSPVDELNFADRLNEQRCRLSYPAPPWATKGPPSEAEQQTKILRIMEQYLPFDMVQPNLDGQDGI